MLAQSENDLMYLIKCGIHKSIPDKNIVDEMDMEAIYKLAKKHYIQAYIAWVLNSMNTEYVLKDKWEDALNTAIHYRMVMDNHARNLFSFLEDKECWYMPLKGFLIKDLYPAYGIRQMADMDILFNPAFRKEVKEYLISKGFKVEDYKKSNHDVYIKDDTYTFEMHVSLFNEYGRTEMYECFEGIKDSEHILKDSYRYSMDTEYFYLYLIAHAYKHYSSGGTGIRQLIDFYYLFHHGSISFDEIYPVLEQLGLLEFEQQIRALSLDCFDKEELTEQEAEMLAYMFHSGIYGNVLNVVINDLDKQDNSKTKYIWKRLFPGRKKVMKSHPFIGKSIVLIPFYWIYRFLRVVTVSRKKVKKELKVLKNKQ